MSSLFYWFVISNNSRYKLLLKMKLNFIYNYLNFLLREEKDMDLKDVPYWILSLDEEDMELIKKFILNSGSLKKVKKMQSNDMK